MSSQTSRPNRAPAGRCRTALAAGGALSLLTFAAAGAGSSTVGAAAPATASVRGLGLGAPSLSAIAHDSRLNRHATALATMAEKLNGSGGEATRGPAQEEYDARAYPAAGVAPAQVTRARAAYSQHGKASQTFSLVGPNSQRVPGAVTYTGVASTVSGRVTALQPVGRCDSSSCTVLAGTAGGGLWRTTNALDSQPLWTPVGAGLTSNAVGALTRAGNLIYAGTGEPNGSSDSEAGTGLFVSTDDGTSFARVPTALPNGADLALGRSVASVVVDASHPQHLLVGTAVARHGSSSVNGGRYTPPGSAQVGLYESLDAGQTWSLAHAESSDPVVPGSANGGDFFRGGVTRVEQDPVDPSTYYAAFMDYGLFRRVGNSAWQQIYTSSTPGNVALSIVARTEFDAVALPNNKTRIYLGDATGSPDGAAGLLRTDDARATAPTFRLLSSANPIDPGAFASYSYCSEQCSYDMPVASPDGQPDTVYLGGQMQYGEIFTAHPPSNGRAVQRSTDAGRSFTDMTNDTANNGLHPDQHAIAFAGSTVLLASDGGINRLSGGFVNRSLDCISRGLTPVQLLDCAAWLSAVPVKNTAINKGLQTLQFQSVSVSPDGGSVLGGTQDNGTWTFGPQGSNSFESVGGDGGQSGFDAQNSTIRYHSYFAPQHDVNFRGSEPTGWNWISDPLLASNELASFYTPFVADPRRAGTVFDGLQHVWRTTDHGGAQAYLERHCNEFTGDFAPTSPCGDWQPLGADLTSTAFGTDKRTGDYVVAITRSTKDNGTMWVGNRRGRLFITHNADAANPAAVAFSRLDSSATPTRFITGIAVDPANSNHAIITYSGYNAYDPSTAGHVFDVLVDSAGHATFTDLSGDLGDIPITGVGVDWSQATVYLGTDFGVLVASRPAPGQTWSAMPGLPVVAVYGVTVDTARGVVYAATHGRSVWAAKL
ncbi:MAG: hypothetical protein JWM02_3462 [Frankiales bacterium]|nr:hypothetical protein [Frankiales bacterium]